MKSIINVFLLLMVLLSLAYCTSKEKGAIMGDHENSILDVKVVNSKDPICNMSTIEHLKDTLTYKGRLYGFCSSHCKAEFQKDPEKYISFME